MGSAVFDGWVFGCSFKADFFLFSHVAGNIAIAKKACGSIFGLCCAVIVFGGYWCARFLIFIVLLMVFGRFNQSIFTLLKFLISLLFERFEMKKRNYGGNGNGNNAKNNIQYNVKGACGRALAVIFQGSLRQSARYWKV